VTGVQTCALPIFFCFSIVIHKSVIKSPAENNLRIIPAFCAEERQEHRSVGQGNEKVANTKYKDYNKPYFKAILLPQPDYPEMH